MCFVINGNCSCCLLDSSSACTCERAAPIACQSYPRTRSEYGMRVACMRTQCCKEIILCSARLDLGLPRQPRRQSLKLKVHSCTARVAISHLTMHRLIKAHVPIIINALALSAGDDFQEAPFQCPDAGRTTALTTTDTFRQRFSKVELSIEEAAVWLCNDGTHSFGAPDVLQVCHMATWRMFCNSASWNTTLCLAHGTLQSPDVSSWHRWLRPVGACAEELVPAGGADCSGGACGD
jgi:hypothetical protein